ncbi:GEM-like protein 7 [Typha latifolia]|uniref:GEM-like protein 7 n=1 Tax=Typha latifolia TaxID=4733 RepID=UPI003C30DA06
MKNISHDQVIGIPVSNVSSASKLRRRPALPECSLHVHSTSYKSSQIKERKVESAINWISKFSKKADTFAQGIRDHVSLGPKISETVKGKLKLGARILQAGGIESVYRQNFSVGKGEKLLKAFQCYLSTTAGPIAGMLFVSNEKVAFHSDRSIAITSSKENLVRIPYKVIIPLRRIKRVSQSENSNKPNQKYIQIVTVDDFEFWFMGFVSYKRSLKYLQQAISDSSHSNFS